jgi:predicted RND superfamily exporter protein
VPAYFSQGVITPDRKTATLAFGIRLMPLERQEQVIETMRRELDPPDGVHAELAGLPVLAADANAAVASPWRRALLLAGLIAVALVLLAAFRDRAPRAVPLSRSRSRPAGRRLSSSPRGSRSTRCPSRSARS